LKAVPDDKLDWRPREGMFTLRELASHIAEAQVALARSALAGSAQKANLNLSNSGIEEIVSALDRHHDELVSEVSKFTLEQLNEEIEFHGRKLRRKVLLYGMTEHEIHHRGQLFTYLRLAGVAPPNLND
jgi:uncharacterized damage-inducible protein DinB